MNLIIRAFLDFQKYGKREENAILRTDWAILQGYQDWGILTLREVIENCVFWGFYSVFTYDCSGLSNLRV